MSITAFPVLARILDDRSLSKTPLGTTALACAAIDDATAWCILAFVIAIVQSTGVNGSIATILLVLLFIGVMLFLVKPRIESLFTERVDKQKYSKGLLAGTVAFALACAWFTENLGIHALFGAFLAGVVMPSASGVSFFLREKLEAFCSAALLPLFFAFTGLRTKSVTQRLGWMADVRGHNRRCSGGQARWQYAHGTRCQDELARFAGNRRLDEYVD